MNRRRTLRWLLLPLILLIALPFPVTSKLEERDTFCIACHTAPEEAYHQRAQDAAFGDTGIPVDLASSHYGGAEPFRCIACHRGDDSPAHRWQTFLLGARDAFTFISGQGDETLEKGTAGEPNLLNAGCLNCHAETLLELGFNNHYHNQLDAARQLAEAGAEPFMPPGGIQGDLFVTLGASGSSIGCVDCHQGHVTLEAGELTLFMDVDRVVYPACIVCHEETGHGPLDLR